MRFACVQELEGFVMNIPKGGILAGAEPATGASARTAGQQSVLGWKSGAGPGALACAVLLFLPPWGFQSTWRMCIHCGGT